MICQRIHTDWGKHLPSIGYGVTIEKIVLGPDSFLVGSRKMILQEWRRALEIL